MALKIVSVPVFHVILGQLTRFPDFRRACPPGDCQYLKNKAWKINFLFQGVFQTIDKHFFALLFDIHSADACLTMFVPYQALSSRRPFLILTIGEVTETVATEQLGIGHRLY